MKRTTFVLAMLFTLTLLLTPAFANNVPDNTLNPVNLWTNLGSTAPSGLTAASAAINGTFTLYSVGVPYTGTYYTQVFKQANGQLVFEYQITSLNNLSAPCPKGFTCSLDVQKISTGDWSSSISVNAKQYGSSGEIASSGVNRLNGVITMYFQNPLITPGHTSYTLLLYTNAYRFTNDTIGIQDGAGDTVAGYVALAPEPATLSLLGFGLLGLGTLRKKLQR